MLSSIGRAAIRRGGAGARFTSTNWSLQRVNASRGANGSNIESPIVISFSRLYATATKTVAKPKAKVTTVKTTKTTKTTKATPETKAKPKKPVKKVKKKLAKPKATKPKKKPIKKVLSDDAKARIQVKVLKEKALSPPTEKAMTRWQVFVQDHIKATGASGPKPEGLGAAATAAAAKYKTLSPEEREALNHRANQNKLAYGIAFKQWVETHTPDQIKEANNARKSLRRKLKKSFSYHRIIDSRIPKQPRNAFTQHSMERHLSGDFKGIPVTEAAKLIGKEWQDLPAAGKQHFKDLAEADMQRYHQEFKTVFQRDPPGPTKTA